MAETAAAYDTASGAGNGMPASYSKSATTNFDSEASFDDSDSVQLSENDILSQNPEKNPDTDPSDSENASAETSQTPMERKLIRNVNMDLETREFDALTKSITDAVTAFGGYIQQSDVSGNSLNWSGDRSSRYSTITARIPSDKLDAFLTEVSSQGKRHLQKRKRAGCYPPVHRYHQPEENTPDGAGTLMGASGKGRIC